MPHTPKSAFGTLLKIGDGTPVTEVFNTIDGVKSITGPGLTAETIDVTHHTTPGSYRRTVPSFLTAGELTFDLLYDSTDAQHIRLLEQYEARETTNFKLVLPDAGVEEHAFAAFVTSFSFNAPIDDALTASVTLTIDGAVTRT